MIHYSCIGATGYVCGEVLRMMVNHHEGELVNVLDTYGVGDAISTHHPALRGFYDQVIRDLTGGERPRDREEERCHHDPGPLWRRGQVGGDRAR